MDFKINNKNLLKFGKIVSAELSNYFSSCSLMFSVQINGQNVSFLDFSNLEVIQFDPPMPFVSKEVSHSQELIKSEVKVKLYMSVE